MIQTPRISTKLIINIIKMRKDNYLGVGNLHEEDRFKKIKFSPDSTDLMSDFSDK